MEQASLPMTCIQVEQAEDKYNCVLRVGKGPTTLYLYNEDQPRTLGEVYTVTIERRTP